MKRFLSLFLAICVSACLLVSCGNTIEDGPAASTEPAQTTADQNTVLPMTDEPVTLAVPEAEMWNGYDTSFVYDNGIEYVWDHLSNETKANLAAALTSIKNVTQFISLEYPITKEENSEYFMHLITDCCMGYPYLGRSFRIIYDENDPNMVTALICSFNLDIINTAEDAQGITAALNQKIAEIVSAMPDGSEYEQIKYLHDALVLNCRYSEDNPTYYTAYGALCDGTATCQGYADAMNLLLSRAGFETVYCIGVGNNESVTHKWNYVKLSDGQWYIVDPTWADPADQTDPEYVNYDYFLVSDEELLKDHKAKNENYYFDEPVATSMEHNFHATEGFVCDSYDSARQSVIKQLENCNANNKHYIYLRFPNEEVYTEVRDKMLKANRDDGSHGEIMQLIEDYGPNFNNRKWGVYNGFEDGEGQYTFIVTLNDKEQ